MSKVIVTSEDELRHLVKEAVGAALVIHQLKASVKKEVKEWMNVAEAAAFLDIKESTLYSYTSRNLIPFIKRTRKLMFKRSDLEKWVEEKRIESIPNFLKSQGL